MKRLLLTAILALGVTSSAVASSPSFAVADIPCTFIANGVEMPAGRYNVEIRLNRIRLVSVDRQSTVDVPASQLRFTQRHESAQIVLKREGDRMHLVAVREPMSNLLRIVGAGY